MKVLFWSESFWPQVGGAEVLAAKLLPALQKRGHRITVLTRADDGRGRLPREEPFHGIQIIRLPFWTALTAGGMDQLMDLRQEVARLKRDFSPDLVHINSLGPSLFFHFATASASPAPVLVTLHRILSEPLVPNSMQSRALRTATWVSAVSAAVLGRAREIAPEITPRSSIVHNGLPEDPDPPAPISIGPARIVCLGRLIPEKGFDLALSAFAMLISRFPAARLIIAGDGLARSDLEREAARLGISDRIELLGWVPPDDVPALLKTASLVVIPSRGQEAFPLVALQAALQARPVVATNVGGLPEVVVDRQTGLLVEPENSRALARAIAFALEDPGTAVEMGRAASRRAREVFGWNRCVDGYESLYLKLGQEGLGC